ncbi:unnamed protein product [Cladocopium goreaui]|uniref:Peptidylprolyl isomerase n=1 Tax=Cladocopium goreaui TaxID=2562237 RepID=A0A9P1CR91_9DINO|nr:unnamed protein product [Cladocopium goreaui]
MPCIATCSSRSPFWARYQWRRKKQDLERHSVFQLQGQRSLSRLHSKQPTAGLISADLYDPSLLPKYACPTSFDEDPELEPMVRRVNNMKKLSQTMQNFSGALGLLRVHGLQSGNLREAVLPRLLGWMG